ncbi:Pentatricopeptide repeat-containing protein, chloroplastic [Heracleum sosnowskyi]|uniref:Pentatricopeptide repeat-containing protein, chloroplastic n=1 Tax=Heracleum sosnowskyi TaxID=360622 RepID=A0AAD8J258_9APIA|nr:Pentatricopeptide repeat-containing protein, chloroplastic [Heracleum sosnowskyi]
MEASPSAAPPLLSTPPTKPNPIEKSIKTHLLKHNITPTPKIIHTLRKKHHLKTLRKTHKNPIFINQEPDQELAHQTHFNEIKREYKNFKKIVRKSERDEVKGVYGKPWERLERNELRELSSFSSGERVGEKLKFEHLRELGDFLEGERDKFKWLLDDDVEEFEGGLGLGDGRKGKWVRPKRPGGDSEAMRFLVDKLSDTKLTVKDWKFGRMMKQSELLFTEVQLIKILEMLGDRGQWSHALSVVEWVYNSKDHKQYKSRYVYTKLLAVLGKARRPDDALQIFNLMCGDYHIYPDMGRISQYCGHTGSSWISEGVGKHC